MRRLFRYFTESAVLTFTGIVGSYLITLAVMYRVRDPAKAAAITVTLCTIWSLVRGFVWRLWIARRSQ